MLGADVAVTESGSVGGGPLNGLPCVLCKPLRRYSGRAGTGGAAYGILDAALAQPPIAQYPCAESVLYAQYAKQQMLGADIAVTEGECRQPRLLDRALCFFSELLVVFQSLVPPVPIISVSVAPIMSNC